MREVCQAIVDEFWDKFIQRPQNKAEWHAVADEFKRRWNFHHTLGSIDGKHVPIQMLGRFTGTTRNSIALSYELM